MALLPPPPRYCIWAGRSMFAALGADLLGYQVSGVGCGAFEEDARHLTPDTRHPRLLPSPQAHLVHSFPLIIAILW